MLRHTSATPKNLRLARGTLSAAVFSALIAPGIALAQASAPIDWGAVETAIETEAGLLPHDPGNPGTFTIDEALGQRGDNQSYLFHFFEQFDVGQGDTAVFTGSDTTAVVGYVAGGTPSKIGGLVRSEIEGADFYFLNPAGVFFGPIDPADGIESYSPLDIKGAAHISSAQDAGFANGMRLVVAPEGGGAPLLEMASLERFGFVGAPIRLDGTVIFFGAVNLGGVRMSQMVDGEISLRGGDIEIAGGGGFIGIDHDVTLVGSGHVLFHGRDHKGFGTSVNWASKGKAAGAVRIRGERVELTDGASLAYEGFNVTCAGLESCGGSVVIEASEEILLHGTGPEEAGTTTRGQEVFGQGYTIDLSLGKGSVDIYTATQLSDVGAGSIELEAPVIRILDGADIVAATAGTKDGGQIRLLATDVLEIAGLGQDGVASRVTTYSPTFSFAAEHPTGFVGTISAEVGTLRLRNGGTLLSDTEGAPAGGHIEVTASELVSISGFDAPVDPQRPPQPSTLQAAQSSPDGTGTAGSITVDAPRIELAEGGRVLAFTQGKGDGGDISLRTDDLQLTGAAVVSAESHSSGSGGKLSIDAGKIRLSERSRITVFAQVGGDLAGVDLGPGDPSPPNLVEGNISISARELLLLEGDSKIEASVETGLGGSIRIGTAAAPANAVVLREGSAILAQAAGTGTGTESSATTKTAQPTAPLSARGGDITIQAKSVMVCPDCEINADGPTTSSAGSVVIQNPETALDAQALPPPVSYLDASSMLLAECGNEAAGGRFTVTRWPDRGLAAEGPLLTLSFLDLGVKALAPGHETPPDTTLAANAPILRGGATSNESAPTSFASLGPLEGELRQAQQSGGTEDTARALAALANGYAALGEYAAAETLLGEAVELTNADPASPGDLVPLRAALMNNRGHVRAMAGRAAEALADYSASAQDAHAEGNLLLAAQAQANAARTALALGNEADSRDALARARQTLEESGATPAEQIEVRIHLAETETALARQDPATRSQALLAAHTDLVQASEDAQREGDPRAASHALGSLGTLYGQETGRDREARYLTRRALQLAEEARAADLLARWYAQLGRLDWRTGQVSAALDAYRRAVEVLGQTRPEAQSAYGRADFIFRRNVEPVYLALVDLLLQSSSNASTRESQQNQLDEARHVVEQWKMAELRNYFRDSCAAELAATARTAETLDPSAAVIYPIVLPDRLELLVSRAAGISRVTVPVTEAELQEEVERFRHLLTKRVTHQYETHAQKLHTWLVDPYRPILEEESIQTLVFVPSGVLRTIPMAALHDGNSFLVERYAVAVTPSLDLLAPKPLDPERTDLLLAGISEPVQGYDELPGVAQELAAIETLYGGEVLLDAEFDRASFASALRNTRPGVVHLASHAEFTGDPNSSFVLTHDDRISIEELASLVRSGRYGDEPVELLMLSACETAVGDERAALGLAGVSIRAGARSAMGSLWSVSDTATSRLISDFYAALQTPGLSKAAALQRAQKSLLANPEFGHPYYWAPFLVMNNWL